MGERLPVRVGRVSLRALGLDQWNRLGLDSGSSLRARVGRLARSYWQLRLCRLGASPAQLHLGRWRRRIPVLLSALSVCVRAERVRFLLSRPPVRGAGPGTRAPDCLLQPALRSSQVRAPPRPLVPWLPRVLRLLAAGPPPRPRPAVGTCGERPHPCLVPSLAPAARRGPTRAPALQRPVPPRQRAGPLRTDRSSAASHRAR
jgi:hypothetical protein